MMHGSKADMEHIYRILISEFLVFALVSFVAALCDDRSWAGLREASSLARGLGLLNWPQKTPLSSMADVRVRGLALQKIV